MTEGQLKRRIQREVRQTSQRQVADLYRVSNQTISLVLQGRITIGPKLARGMGYELETVYRPIG